MRLVNKPVGVTSFDVIRILRKTSKAKMGHAGTLDPLASGLMIILEDSETKSAADFLGLPKTYEVTARVGEKRTTGDLEGDILEEKEVTGLTNTVVKETLSSLIGSHKLPVPLYSAVKRGGEALYKKARRGETLETPVKEMTVHSLKYRGLMSANGRVDVAFTANVSSGTYIRSLVEELGARLGYPATTAALRRTEIGDYSVENAEELET